MNRKSISLILAVIAIFVLLSPFAQAASIQKFGIDSRTYSSRDTISVSGEILDGNLSGQVKIIIWQGDQFPDSGSGEYTIVAVDNESGSISPWLNFNVLGINNPKNIKIILTEGEVLAVSLSGSSGITGSLASGKTGGNLTFMGNTYYFLVSNDNIAYMDDDSNMNLSSDSSGNAVVGNLIEGSKIKLNTTTYTIIHINNETQIVLLSRHSQEANQQM